MQTDPGPTSQDSTPEVTQASADEPLPVAALREASRLTWRTRRPLLVYGFGQAILVTLVLAPLFSWLVLWALRVSVGGAVVNFEIASFAASLPALAIGLVWAIGVAALALVGFGGPVLILTSACVGRAARLDAVVGRVLRSIPRAAARGAIRLTLVVFLALPLAGLAVSVVASLALAPLGGIELEMVLPDNFIEVSVVTTLVLVLGSICFYFAVRWSFCLHFFLVARRSLGASMAASTAVVRGRFWRVARAHLLMGIANALLVGLVALLLGGIHWVLLRGFEVQGALGVDVTLALLLVLDAVVFTAVITLTSDNVVSLATVLFVRLASEHDVRLDDESLVRNQAADAQPLARRRPRLTLALVLGALLVATLLTIPGIVEERAGLSRKILVTAHRGNSSVAPDNTLAAIRASIDAKADFAEIDIQEAKDGTLVVIHDTHLLKIAGLDRQLYDMTGDELREVDVGSHFDPRFASERIPTLEEAIRTAGDDLRLNIELKVHGREKDFAPSAVAQIHALDFGDRCVITSLDAAVLAEVRRLDPDLKLGIILTAAVGDVHAMDVDFYSVNSLQATNDFIRGAHARGRQVHVWTLNEENKIRRMIDRFPDNIISDYPDRVRAILEARTPEDVTVAAVRRLFAR